MKTFRVYSTCQSLQELAPVLIEDSFSFKAAIFNFFWLLYYGLWSETLLLIGAQLGLNLISNFIGEGISLTLQLLMLLALGVFASEIRIMNLCRQGYKFKDIVVAQDKEKARLKFFQSCLGENNGH